MTGHQYAQLIIQYIGRNYKSRGLAIYREVPVGKSIIGKNRRIDIFVVLEAEQKALAIECKYQDSQGTVDEKIPYAIEDMDSLPMPGCIVYAGSGFSQGVLHMLESSEIAAYCLPDETTLKPTKLTKELDHMIAIHFKWWDILIGKKKPEEISE